MKLIRQTILFFKEGNSDKTYEVDLYEVAHDEYLVNFRYGRRNTGLKEGTKTVFPVSLVEAQRTFEKLVDSKIKKGYSETEPLETVITTTEKNREEPTTDLRASRVLDYLSKAVTGAYNEEKWPLSRVVWRAGELKLIQAEKYLIKLEFTPDDLFNYSLIWALGRCGGQAALMHIKELKYGTIHTPIGNLARVALVTLGNDELKNKLNNEATQQLPKSLHSYIDKNDEEALSQKLNELIFELKIRETFFLKDLYLIAITKSWILNPLRTLLKSLPLTPPFFKVIRSIFKTAEFNSDFTTYGILAKRIETTQQFYSSDYGSTYVNETYIKIKEEVKKQEPRIAYSKKTKAYFERRILRSLQRLGQASSIDYTKMATGYLLSYDQNDSHGTSETTHWEYNNGSYSSIIFHHPDFSNYKTFCFLLYNNSNRLEQVNKNTKWRFKQGVDNNLKSATQREEAFPNLWNNDCESLTVLLNESTCYPVLDFALIAFNENEQKDNFFTSKLAVNLLRKTHENCNLLGLDIAKRIIDSSKAKQLIILACLNSENPELRTQGFTWFSKFETELLTSNEFIISILFSKQQEIHQWIQKSLVLPKDQAIHIASHIITNIETLIGKNKYTEDQLRQIFDSLNTKLSSGISDNLLEALVPLVNSNNPLIKVFALNLLAVNTQNADNLSESFFEELITDKSEQVRALAVELFGKLSLETLKNKKDILMSFAISEHQEIRQAVSHILARVVTHDSSFGLKLSQFFVSMIHQKEKYEGLNRDLISLFKGPLKNTLSQISNNTIWSLIDAFPSESNQLAYMVLKTKGNIASLTVPEWVKFGNNELLDLRKICWQMFEQNVSKVKKDAQNAVKLLDATWNDSKQFALAYFDNHFKQADWNPDLLISICDSNTPTSQDYGKAKITQFLNTPESLPYLLRLSEHPASNLQLFVSSYIEKFVKDNPKNLKQLEPFIVTALSQINKGRIVKIRLFKLLEQEATNNLLIAEWLVPIITRISLTIAIRDKSDCLNLLFKITKKYPNLASPIVINQPVQK